jgi:FAD:protein FMN transferase
MGSVFDISIVAQDSVQANEYIDRAVDEIDRIESLISEWRPETQLSEVNRKAGIRPVKVDREVFELTQRAIDYSIMTGGAFDISIAAMDKLWRYDGTILEMPTPEAVRKSVEKVGYLQIVLDTLNSSIYLARQGMKIGFGSIGKVYAADRCRKLLQADGVTGGIVNASGDLSAWGKPTNRKAWAIGINNPFKNQTNSKNPENKNRLCCNFGKLREICRNRWESVFPYYQPQNRVPLYRTYQRNNHRPLR